MLDAFEKLCVDLGRKQAFVERFTPRSAQASPRARSSHSVELRRSGIHLHATPGKSLLQSLLDAGVTVPHSCMQGVCGACRTRVLAGEPDHRDSVLSAEERAANDVMTVCVSGCKSDLLVLDL
jgi:ferredoxin